MTVPEQVAPQQEVPGGHGGVPALVRTRAALRRALGEGAQGAGTPAADGSVAPRVALVMTMGALHAGHLGLVRAAREAVGPRGRVVVSIFVNPLQFGPDEDFARYPRDLDADLALLADSGAVDLVFAPATAELYPSGPLVTVSAGSIGRVLEGVVRPGHFDGVLTVVLKVLNLVRPDTAVFGEKDAQQLLAVRRMAADLDLDVEIRGVPIVRDADGLALSSRNAYLSAADRRRALALAGALRAGAEAGERGASAVRTAAEAVLEGAGIVPDYLALVDPATVEEVSPGFSGTALLLVAARVGSTRLIDNTAVRLGAPARPGGA